MPSFFSPSQHGRRHSRSACLPPRRLRDRTANWPNWLLAALLAVLLTPRLSADTPETIRPIAVGLGGFAYWCHGPFANTLLSSAELLEFSNNWGEPAYFYTENGTLNPQFNARGLPQYLNPGRKFRILMWPYAVHAGSEPADWPKRGMTGVGKWVVTWQGDADIRMQSGTFIAAESSGPATGRLVNGRRVYQMSVNDLMGHLTIEDINASVGLSDLKVWLPDPANPTAQSLENSGQFWHPAFINNLNSMEFGSIRFMDWGNTNASPQRDWSDRRRPDFFIQNGVLNRRSPAPGVVAWSDGTNNYYFDGNRYTGVAWEHMIQLANLTNRDMWICVPHMATDDYVTKLAQLIRYGSDGVNPYTSPQANPVYPPLNPNLRVWLEYSNEIWSSGNSFPQGNWAEAQAIAAGLGSGNQGKARFNARRASQIWSLFQQVFGGSQRIVRVGAIFTASGDYNQTFLTELKDYGATLTPAVQPDVISPTTYFGNGIQDWAYEQANLYRYNPEKSWFHTEQDFVYDPGSGATRPVSKPLTDPYWTSDRLNTHYQKTFEEWKRRIFSGSTIGGGGFDTTGEQGGFNASLATTIQTIFNRNIPIVSYEGGPSLYTDYLDWGDSRDDGITNFMIIMNRRPEFEEIYRIQLNMARSKGLACHGMFVDIANYGRFGQWGHLEYMDQPHATAPKWMAVKNWGDDMMNIRNPIFPVGARPDFVTPGTLPQGAYLQAYSTDIVATGGDLASGGQYQWQVVGSLLAPGLAVGPVPGDHTRYLIQGTPQSGGWNYVYLRVSDSDGDAAWKVFSLYIPGGPGTLVESNLSGNITESSLPYTATQALDGALITWSGLNRGAAYQSTGGSARAGADGVGVLIEPDTDRIRFAVSQGDLTEDASTLASAIADNEYLGFTLTPQPGQSLDLRGAELQLTWDRLGWHAPRQLAVFTSIGGFADGQQIYTSPRNTEMNSPTTLRFKLPETLAYGNITTPVQFRIYFYRSQWSHRAAFLGLKLTRNLENMVPAEPLPPVFSSNPFSRPAATATVAYSGSIATAAYDPNLEPITWSKISGPAWLSVSSNGSLSGTPAESDVGANTFTVRATDPGGLFAEATLSIVVEPVPVIPTAAAPVFSPASGNYTGSVSVTLSSSTSGASIRYTLNGADPTSTTGTLYTAPLLLTANATVRAIAYASGYLDSPVSTASYTITAPPPPPSGNYTVWDSTQPGGPSYNWVDTSTAAGGTALWAGGNTDDVIQTVSFGPGFTFPFYGNTHTQVRVGSNGFLMFYFPNPDGLYATNTRLPNSSTTPPTAPRAAIAGLWTDLYIVQNFSSVTYRQVNADTWAVTFHRARLYSQRNDSSRYVSFQIVLRRNGEIQINYRDNLYPSFSTYTIGIQNEARTVGLQFSYNTAWLPTGANINRAILFSQGPVVPAPQIALVSPAQTSVAIPPGAGLWLDTTVTLSDGNPVTLAWSKVTGPGSVTFDAPNAADTGAFFSAAGNYTLRLSATGNNQTTTLDVGVNVTSTPPAGTPVNTIQPGIIITARGENAAMGEGAASAFDGSNSTKWLDFSPDSTNRSSWIQVQYPSGQTHTVRRYTITSANDAPERDPANWALLGSNDGTNWTTLDTRTSEVFTARFQTRTFDFTNNTAYNYYRLRIDRVANPAAANSVQLAEITLLTVPNGNLGPIVSAGIAPTNVIVNQPAALTGSVTDDGLPNPPGAVIVTWSKLAGPGTVTFANPNAAATTFTAAATGGYTLRLAASDGQVTTLSNLAVTVASASPYQAWVASQPGLLALPEPDRQPLADPDSDGLPNLLEFALGGAPTDPASRPLPAVGTATVSGQQRLTLTFTPQQATGLRYVVQASTDLSDWSDQSDLTDQLVVGQPFTFTDSADLATTPRRFLRLRVTLLP